MSAKTEKAKELFMQGYNCSQAVVGAFCEDLGLDLETAMKLSSSFGGGMGRLREVCGAVSGAFMVAGLKYGYSDPTDKTAKTQHYKLIQDMAAKFKEQNGSIICRELLGVGDKKETFVPEDRTKEYYKKRPCAELVEIAAKITEEMLNTK
ncbi:MAG: C_GCAxxG_C_C family protein [Clostridia bacterium]|nr:C_GCAxxG_C_C family protein [Clostridia bacterium]